MTAPAATAAAAPTRTGAEAAIQVDRLTKAYGGRRVVDGISFRVEPGETFALLGPNGAGKTTTVEILEGYRRADDGQARVLGDDPGRADRGHRARVGLMLQGGGGVDPRMSAREALALYARFHSEPRDVDELLALVGLSETDRTRFRRLSGGERQRLGLALALVGRPSLLMLDEPTAGMDVEGRAATRELLGRLRAEGVTILVTSHDLADVERTADRIAILDRGRVVAIGSPGALAGGGAAGLSFRLDADLADADRVDMGARVGGDAIAFGGGRYRLEGVPPSPAVVSAVAAWCAARGVLIVELRAGSASLEERYLELVGAQGEQAS